jgi:ELWxxDGT repeat protein
LDFSGTLNKPQDELWVSDGTAEGTQLVRSFASIGSQGMALAGNRIFFTANDGSGYGGELWVSDGTAGGTYLVKYINPGSGWSNSGPITGFGNKVVFAADDGIHGKEPWISDGTEAGTYMIIRILSPALAHPTHAHLRLSAQKSHLWPMFPVAAPSCG